ncbi:hypothetical protein IX317_001656 [Fusobacterium sp. DD29]|nr:hypothetical protein [Fusobacterium sp. DD29]MBR8762211.1 hypothetical protein [Fusobacterium sp. DD25]MBR8768235.1 hypothetical protein [Fusobacterium sp. DD43]MBR8772311.1 hypothetical protein [Fusobacterium sp. DD40]MBR8776530.1 hypothetical protein [Fusobacterium sp. DD17]MBR8798793.1 hypothetical protein [Fusobacterium sp. DD12]MBR8800965.1 hypothetical protein [Fusobacterium sp. DD10]MBR8805273.1 hypothetical protein [Fusobacterium sp. DD13]MBR8812439.1 hypothetical protein [Fusoba
MYEYDLKELIRIVSSMNQEEWDSFKSFIDHKFKFTGHVENNTLTYDTLKTFFINIKKSV